jgi:mono/diheme cytochrome c family protein
MSKKGKVYLLGFALASLIGLAGCESTSFAPPPPVTVQMADRKGQRLDVATLEGGRTLFVHRCIECHTLPPFWHYRAKDWPELVDSMAHRARLKPRERDAIVAYILAARGQ